MANLFCSSALHQDTDDNMPGTEVTMPHSAVLTDGHAGQLHRGPTSIGPHANQCMMCTAFFLMINYTDFVGSTNTIYICSFYGPFTFLFL
jgi:hypothetical protein